MVRPVFLIIIAVWSLAMLPALCGGGFIEHACEHDHETEPCSHDCDCAGDPCSQILSSREENDAGVAEITLDLSLIPAPDCVRQTIPRRPPRFRNSRTAGLPRPCHESDLPLLI